MIILFQNYVVNYSRCYESRTPTALGKKKELSERKLLIKTLE